MQRLNQKIQELFGKLCQTGKLFRVAMTGQQVWELYLKSFSKKNDPIFRDPNSTTHNCNHCKNFIRRYGNIVAVVDGKIRSMFDVECNEEYQASMSAMSAAIKDSEIADVFFETFDELNSLPYEKCSKNNIVFRLGVAQNHKRYTKEEAQKYGVVSEDEIKTFNHMHLDIPILFVDDSGKSVEAIMGTYRDGYAVFERGMREIPLDTLLLVRDLIVQGSLLDGQTHLNKLEAFATFKRGYDEVPAALKDNWCWVNSYGNNLARFKNELIGVLCTELAEGKEINSACQAWNKRVDPANYMKALAPITKKQIEEAKKFVEENGYAESFNRRFATMEDIKVSEIKHMNVGDGKTKSVSIFDNVKSTSTRHKRSEFDGIEEVSVDKFMTEILPNCSAIEVFLKNSHEGNLVTLTTASGKNSKPIFKWDNNYSWTFNGNLAGKSQIKEAVKSEGGKIDGALRFSIVWNEDGQDIVDFDAHAKEPNGVEIAFNTYKGRRTLMSGMLDVDMINPVKMGVENIVWSDQPKMKDGVYKFWIRNFNARANKGFKAEIEFDGETYSYEYNKFAQGDTVVAEVTLKDGQFSIKHMIPESTVSSKELYGLETNNFHKVNMVCLSPNHWDGNNIGNKHYMFMLDGCQCLSPIRSFHNENLIPDLLQHRKVMEVLGTTNMIEPRGKQLSGLGFNATVRDEAIVRLSGSFKRVVKIKF